MKVTRRSDNGKSGHLLISVPASRVAEVEAALTFLEEKRQQRGSQVVIDLIVRAALRNGWRQGKRHGTVYALRALDEVIRTEPAKQDAAAAHQDTA
jgi:hypothetical protein